MRRRRSSVLLAGGLAAAAVPASGAQAAPVLTEPIKPCYVSAGRGNTEPVTLAGEGFTPGSLVRLLIDGAVVNAGVPIDGRGVLEKGNVESPFIARGERPFEVTVTERDNPAQTVSARSRVTALAVSLSPLQASASTRVVFRGRGFTGSGAVYAHYVRRGRSHANVRLGRPRGPCGTFRARRRQFPFNPSAGRWTLQVDQQRRYSRRPRTNFVRRTIIVR